MFPNMLKRPALGQVAALGSLYDARSDALETFWWKIYRRFRPTLGSMWYGGYSSIIPHFGVHFPIQICYNSLPKSVRAVKESALPITPPFIKLACFIEIAHTYLV